MFIVTKLAILHIDFETGSQRCLMDDDDLPFYNLLNKHPVDMCPIILENFLEIESDWVTFLLIDVGFEDETLIIYYTCLIPAIVNNTQGQWTDIGDIKDGKIQKLVFEAGQKIIAQF